MIKDNQFNEVSDSDIRSVLLSRGGLSADEDIQRHFDQRNKEIMEGEATWDSIKFLEDWVERLQEFKSNWS